MKQIETEVIIDVPIDIVWRVIMDFKNYPEWNPFITSIRGQKKPCKRLQIALKTKKGKIMNFKSLVLKCNDHDEFRWIGKVGIRGIFDGEHYFALESLGPNQTRFIHGEFFSGLLLGFMSGLLQDTHESFVLMNEALKLKCESRL